MDLTVFRSDLSFMESQLQQPKADEWIKFKNYQTQLYVYETYEIIAEMRVVV